MKIIVHLIILSFFAVGLIAQTPPLAERMADTAMNRVWTDSPNGKGIPPRWNYDQGVVLSGMRTLWYTTADKQYFDFIKKGVDAFVNPDSTIKTYAIDQYSLDLVRMGTAVLTM